MNNIFEAPFVKEMCDTTANMYRLGWDERNGGNISYRLDASMVEAYLDPKTILRTLPLNFDASYLAGQYFIVTATGKYFKNVSKCPQDNMGVIRIQPSGKAYDILWGFADGSQPTSELPTHLMNHIERLKVDPKHRVVMHCHPLNILSMTFVHDLDEKAFTKTLWRMCTECIVVFPEGIGVLPWMVCGNNAIGEATAEKIKDHRIVLWSAHGIFGTGETMDETFGLIETVEKAAQVYMTIGQMPIKQSITDAQLLALCQAFGIEPRAGYLESSEHPGIG